MDTVLDVTPTAIEDETPALPDGKVMFWRDDSGEWQEVVVTNCEPAGWGWCDVEWSNYDGTVKHKRSVPIIKVVDLETRLEQDSDYSEYELANARAEYNNQRALGALGYLY